MLTLYTADDRDGTVGVSGSLPSTRLFGRCKALRRRRPDFEVQCNHPKNSALALSYTADTDGA